MLFSGQDAIWGSTQKIEQTDAQNSKHKMTKKAIKNENGWAK